jgi:hypothetical protein
VISANSSYLSNLAEHFNKHYADGGFFVPPAASESDAPMKKRPTLQRDSLLSCSALALLTFKVL